MGPHLQALICFLDDPNLILYFIVKMIFFVIFYNIGWIYGWKKIDYQVEMLACTPT